MSFAVRAWPALIGAIVLALSWTPTARAELAKNVPHLEMEGAAARELKPDRAALRFTIAAERKTAPEAGAELARMSTEVVATLTALGIPRTDIRTETVALVLVFDADRAANGVVTRGAARGYRAATAIDVTVTDMDKTRVVIDGLLDKGTANLTSIHFSHSGAATLASTLRNEAIAQARARAERVAAAAGTTLGRIIQIESREPDTGERTVWQRGIGAAFPIEPGALRVSVSVSITWQLGD